MFSPNQSLSLADLSRGVNTVHMAIGKLPGSQRIDPTFRAAQEGMFPAEVIEQYNNARKFGTTKKGEPLRASLVENRGSPMVIDRPMELPNRFSLMLRPEGARKLDPAVDSFYNNPSLHFSSDAIDDISRGEYPMSYGMMQRLQRNKPPGAKDPRAYSINAMGTRPDEANVGDEAWWKNVPNKGQDLYALAYDVLRSAGQGNVTHGLTDVNKARRLYNVGAYRMGHGNFKGIAPLEEPYGQLFRFPIDDAAAEAEYLERLYGMRSNDPKKYKQGADLYDETIALTEKKLADDYGKGPISGQLQDDELAGLLFLREAQIAGTYGPKNAAGEVGGLRLGDFRPEDTAELRNLVEPFQADIRASGNRFRPGAAMSANTLGRQITTEATIKRMLRGEEPEEIAADIIGRSPETAFTGRYRKGGLVAAMG